MNLALKLVQKETHQLGFLQRIYEFCLFHRLNAKSTNMEKLFHLVQSRGSISSNLLIGMPETLPNIKATFRSTGYEIAATGAGYVAYKGGKFLPGGDGYFDCNYGFDASRSNPIYKDNAHVQPTCMMVKSWQRMA